MDADLALKDLLIGLAVLRDAYVEIKTPLKDRRDLLNVTDCLAMELAGNSDKDGHATRMIVACFNHVPNNAIFESEEDKTQKISVLISNTQPDSTCRKSVAYFEFQKEKDKFFNASALDPVDDDQKDDVESGLHEMVEKPVSNSLPENKTDVPSNILSTRINVFCTSFSSSPPAKVVPLKIDLVVSAKPVCICLRNYSQDQRKFLFHFVSQLVAAGMTYFSPSVAWA